MTRETCDNIGGFFVAGDDSYHPPSTTTTTTTGPTDTTDSSLSFSPAVDSCYYYNFDCPGYVYRNQCYSRKSFALSCPSCNNIGGMFAVNYGCYYESSNCSHFSAGGQCHPNRCYKPPSISFVVVLYAQYTPPTRRNCRVASRRRCVHEFATSWRQFHRVVGVNTPVGRRDCKLAADGCVVRSNPSAVSSRIHVGLHTADATRQNSFVALASAVCIGLYVHIVENTKSIVFTRNYIRVGTGRGLPVFWR